MLDYTRHGLACTLQQSGRVVFNVHLIQPFFIYF